MRKTLILKLKRDNLIVDFLKSHRGKQSAVTMQDIADFLKDNGISLQVRTIDPIVKQISFDRCLPILHCAKGYYWASTQEEIRENINHFKNRIALMQTHITHLNNFVIKFGGGGLKLWKESR